MLPWLHLLTAEIGPSLPSRLGRRRLHPESRRTCCDANDPELTWDGLTLRQPSLTQARLVVFHVLGAPVWPQDIFQIRDAPARINLKQAGNSSPCARTPRLRIDRSCLRTA